VSTDVCSSDDKKIFLMITLLKKKIKQLLRKANGEVKKYLNEITLRQISLMFMTVSIQRIACNLVLLQF